MKLSELLECIKEATINHDHLNLKMYYDDNAPINAIHMYPDKVVFTEEMASDHSGRVVRLQNVIQTLKADHRQDCEVTYEDNAIVDVIAFSDSIILLRHKVQ